VGTVAGSSPVLALNSGSSSLKFGVFATNKGEVRALYRGSLDGIGTKESRLELRSTDGSSVVQETLGSETQPQALREVGRALGKLKLPALAAVGHRIVHGGPELREHQRLTAEVIKKLEAAATFAPLHVPIELELIRETQSQFRDVPQFACFDTAFHRTLPELAARFALPEKFWQAGVRRYGFHGLSCESILHALGEQVPRRTVIAHLGNGASVTALADGRSVDTSMGLTPTGGIIMGTRTGDLDPGVLLHVVRNGRLSDAEVEKLVDKQSGLLGISGVSSDMRELHKAASDTRARLAIAMFCRTVKKEIGAYAAVLGGIDLLIFSGGIGEHDAAVREEISSGLEFLGVGLDSHRNAQHAPVISKESARVTVRLVPSDEEAQIARHVFRLLA
jgi:acetate kinase